MAQFQTGSQDLAAFFKPFGYSVTVLPIKAKPKDVERVEDLIDVKGRNITLMPILGRNLGKLKTYFHAHDHKDKITLGFTNYGKMEVVNGYVLPQKRQIVLNKN